MVGPRPASPYDSSRSASLARLRPVSVAVLLLAAVLVSPGNTRAEAAPDPDPARDTSLTQAGLEPTAGGLSEPDAWTATQKAHSLGQRVEVVELRTEFQRTWALPQGGYASETTGSPVRFRDHAATDGWRDVDTTLTTNPDGTVSPKAVPLPIVLGGSDDPVGELVTTQTDGQSLSFGSGIGTTLPEPMLHGSTATYSDVLPGVDVVVEARSTGFEQLWVAKDRPALDALLSTQASGEQGISASIDTARFDATSQPDGSVELTDSSKTVVSEVSTPTVWDATTAPDGTPAAEIAANLDVVEDGDIIADTKAATGDLDLSVSIDQAWLDDPARRFPVTIDPTYVVGAEQAPIFDTYVKEGATTDRSDSTYLPVGYGYDNDKNRSFLNFDTTPFQGRIISAGSLSLWSDNAGTCTPNGWSAFDAGLATTASRWTAQPTLGAKYATSTATKGFSSSCAAGRVSIDMTSQLQAWSNNQAETKGVALVADNENGVGGYHRFWSSDASSNLPVLSWTWTNTSETDDWAQQAGPSFVDNQEALTDYIGWLNDRPEMEADGFVAPDLDIPNKSLTLLWKGGSSPQQQALAEGASRGVGVVIKQYPYSSSEIDAAQNQIFADEAAGKFGDFEISDIVGVPGDQTTPALKIEGIVSSSSRLAAGGAPTSTSQVESRAEASTGVNVVVASDVDTGESYTRSTDYSPFNAGGFMADNSACSTGFAISIGGTTHTTTARHCVQNNYHSRDINSSPVPSNTCTAEHTQ